MKLNFGREICSNLKNSESREWLVTNGIGGYACGTIANVLTRGYHGLLLAALKPPVARTLLLTKLDEVVEYNGKVYELCTNRWADGTVEPQGYLNLESFHLEGTIPVWNFAFADGLLEKRIWMQQGENTTYIRYTHKRGSQALTLSLKALVNYRDYHSATQGKSLFAINQFSQNSLEIRAFAEAVPFYLLAIEANQKSDFNWSIDNTWYRDFGLAIEKYRGLDEVEDHLNAAVGKIILQPGDILTIVATTHQEREATIYNCDREQWDDTAITRRERELVNLFSTKNQLPNIPPWIEQLVLATEQFIAARPLRDNPEGKTIIAGYPWFTDWGRDTMISLPGLTLATGRYDTAKTILRTFAQYADRGMLPNLFPDAGETPVYNTVDATLWYFEAIRAYYATTQDRKFIAELFPLLAEIISWHLKGTRHNIQVDSDGLLYAGESGVQLTWMDAKVDDWVVTPRIGKPIEISVLWYNALVCMNYFAEILGKSGAEYQQMAAKTRSHFPKFWYEPGGYCYDVIDSPCGNDVSFRSNQIFAVSLPAFNGSNSLLETAQQKLVVDRVGQTLLISQGLRSLAPSDSNYVGIYGGKPLQRDGAYHQGTAWGWSIGHFVQAHLKVYQNPALARSFLDPMVDHLRDGCIGSISEIFDGDPPFTSRGCFAHAWSVAEVLRGWLMTYQH